MKIKTTTTLETKRLSLRRPMMKDVAVIARELNNQLISDNTLTIPFPYTKEDAVRWVRKNQLEWKDGTSYVFVLISKKTDDIIGAMGLHLQPMHDRAEVGYWIAASHWNKGYATEALKAVLEFGFTQLNLHKIFATHMLHNPSSGKVMQKAGMIREAKLKEHFKKRNRYVTVIQYRLTKKEYFKSILPQR